MIPQAQADQLWSHLKKMKVAMFCTSHENGYVHSRPMHHVDQDKSFSGTMHFFTGLDSEKVADIKREPKVCLSYADHDKEDYLCVTGQAYTTQDKGLIEKFWSPMVGGWFDGKDDPNLALLAVEVEHAELWDTTGNRMVQLFEFVKASYFGGRPNVGEYKKIA